MTGREEELERLRDALEASQEFAADGDGLSVDEFLTKHASVRELLEPLVSKGEDAPELSASAIDQFLSLVRGGAAASEAFDELIQRAPEHARQLREFLDRSSESRRPSDRARSDGMPESIGEYRVLDSLGAGGFGRVYLAEQREPIRRRVAVKVIKLGMDSESVLRRFDAERQALAIMEHVNIAKVFDAGTTESGQPYFAMEFVPGEPLVEYCDQNRLSIADRIALFGQVCAGVQHAHQKGVMHRDLKPSNVMVTSGDSGPVAKIIDFGLARATDHRLSEVTLYTERDAIVGTPEYMSPEQAGLGKQDIDTRTDVYSLGAMLYEMFVGIVPFRRSGNTLAAFEDLRRRIRDEDPPRPSSRVSTVGDTSATVAMQRGADPRSLTRRLRGDLDWIVLKALEKDRTRRYQTPMEVFADLQRFLADEPVLATPPSLIYQLGKFARRYRPWVAGACATILALVAGLSGTLWFAFESDERRQALASQNLELLRASRRNAAFTQLGALRSLIADYPMPEPWPEAVPTHRAWLARCDDVLAMPEPDWSDFEPLDEEMVGGARAALALVHRNRKEVGGDRRRWVAKRLERALQAARDVERYADRWAEAIEAIRSADGQRASELYAAGGGVELTIQPDLVPIGMNPVTKLWEFYHPSSGGDPDHVPEFGEGGRIDVRDETGMVFVLVPQRPGFVAGVIADPDQAKHVKRSDPVDLAAFFIGRFEITQAQWLRMTEENPSNYQPNKPGQRVKTTLSHPVESVTWLRATGIMLGYAMTLPTEAQWEYAARANTDSYWHCGDDDRGLEGFANVKDVSYARHVPGEAIEVFFDDGFAATASVGRFNPNAFGLHDTMGNVCEWCLDEYHPYAKSQLRAGDGLRGGPKETNERVHRGGTFFGLLIQTRPYRRLKEPQENAMSWIGVRACRQLDEYDR